jgi:hypothetical protein
MGPLSMEAVFLMLSGVILLAGVLYWFWSHIQLTQKKVQLLENAVFELRGLLNATPPPPPASTSTNNTYEDLPDEEGDGWDTNDTAERVIETVSTPIDQLPPVYGDVQVEHLGSINDDLMPGGRIEHVDEHEQEKEEAGDAQDADFRELFVGREVTPSPVRTPESLDSMPVKELRRLAEQRGIAGAADMRKKEILAALRKQLPPAAAETVVQKTLDLTEEDAPAVAETVEAEILE